MARFGVDLRLGEEKLFSLFFGVHFLLLAFQYTAKSVRQSAFIDALGAENLPWAYLLVPIASYPLLALGSRWTRNHTLEKVLAGISGGVGASLLAFAWLFHRWPDSPVPSLLFYVWTAVVGVLMVSLFWSWAAERLDVRQARRLFAAVGAGGILGSVFGGQLARLGSSDLLTGWLPTGWEAAGALGLAALVLGLLTVVMALGARVLPDRRGRETAPARTDAPSPRPTDTDADADRGDGGESIWTLVRRSRYLQLISGIMLLSALVAQVVDLQLAWVLEQRTSSLAERTAAYGNLYSIMGLAALVFQVFFTARIHRRLGLGFALRVLPVSNGVAAIAFLVAAAFAPAALLLGLLWPVVWTAKVMENGLRYSLEQVTRELLFLPVPEEHRPRAKAFVDVVVQRAAKGVAAVALLSVAFGWLTVVQTAWISLAAVLVWLTLLGATRDRYVATFREGLLARLSESDDGSRLDLRDAATLEALVAGLGSADRREVCHSLDLLGSHGKGFLVPPTMLAHPEPDVRLRTLEILRRDGRRQAVPWVEQLLSDPEPAVRTLAFRTLAALVPESLAREMGERLLDSDPRVRSVAVAYLASHADPAWQERADSSLVQMIADPDIEVRQEAARAIGELDEPRFQAGLVQLLYDPDLEVIRAAIGAVEARCGRGCTSPLYVPILVSHLHQRKLKHEARATLVSYGESIIPALQHFLFDNNENIWVRRALPLTIARIGGPAALASLTEALGARDPFQRAKVIRALAELRPDDGPFDVDRQVIETVIGSECREIARLRLDRWSLDEIPGRAGADSLLARLLDDRIRSHAANVFRLLALVHPAREIRAARRGLLSGRPALRTHALEYLDNVLRGAIRQEVFVTIDDLPRDDRLREIRRLWGLTPEPASTVLRRLATERPLGDFDAPWLTAATLQLICDAGLEILHPLLRRAAERDPAPLVQETAALLIGREPVTADLSGSHPRPTTSELAPPPAE